MSGDRPARRSLWRGTRAIEIGARTYGSVRSILDRAGHRRGEVAIIELGASNLGVGVDKGLLVDTPDPLQIANIERVLGAAVARMLALKFAMGLLLGLGLFQRDELGLGQYQALPQRSWPPVL